MSESDHDDACTFYAGGFQGYFIKISLNSDTHELKIRFFDSTHALVNTIKLPNLCNTESVLEFKPRSNRSGSLEEQCGGRVWIRRSDGHIECPMCGYSPDYDGYLDKAYNSDHRNMPCPKCKTVMWFNHNHINGVCQPIPEIVQVEKNG